MAETNPKKRPRSPRNKDVSGPVEIVEEYFQFCEPELFEKFSRLVPEAPASIRNISVEELTQAYRARWRKHLETYNAEILDAIGWTIDDLLDARDARNSRKRGARTLPQGKKALIRRTAYRAIHCANIEGLKWSETMQMVQDECRQEHDDEPDRKTIESWLRVLSSWDMISIAPPAPRKKGRPKKE